MERPKTAVFGKDLPRLNMEDGMRSSKMEDDEDGMRSRVRSLPVLKRVTSYGELAAMGHRFEGNHGFDDFELCPVVQIRDQWLNQG